MQGRNPSEEEDQPRMEKRQTLRAEIQARKKSINEVRDSSDLNVGNLRKESVSNNGQVFKRDKPSEDEKSDQGGSMLNGPKVKYLGSWDSELGRMVYEPIEEISSELLRGQEKEAQHYPPCVGNGTKEQLYVVAIEDNMRANLAEENCLKRRKEPELIFSRAQNGRGGWNALGPTISWKKRARQGQGSPRKGHRMAKGRLRRWLLRKSQGN
jgi:hypothetical protein